MKSAALPENESERLQALFDYNVLDTVAEEAFDQLTELASSICQTPIALVSLVDETRQWFKSHYGIDATETPREYAFCAHAIHDNAIFEIKDSRKDERFHDNPLVTGEPNVIFYAGISLETPSGQNIGTLCVIDNKPSELSELQKQQLGIIAKQVIAQLELRKNNRMKDELFKQLMELNKQISLRNEELDAFSVRAAHDLKAPIRQISQLAHFCLEDFDEGELREVRTHCNNIMERCSSLQELIKAIFDLTRADTSTHENEEIELEKLVLQSIADLTQLAEEKQVDIRYSIPSGTRFFSERIRIQQIIYNLLSNAIKYASLDETEKRVDILAEHSDGGLKLSIRDNGLGIPASKQSKLFSMFERFHPNIAEGTGLGMSIVKKHVDALQATIGFESSAGGTCFDILFPQGASKKLELMANNLVQEP